MLGFIAYQDGQPAEAVAWITKALAINPGDPAANYRCGVALHDIGRLQDAVDHYDRALAAAPGLAEACFNRGNALASLQRYLAAIDSFDAAIAIKPDHAQAFNNRGNAQKALREYDAAIASYDQAIALSPGYADAHNNRGNALRDLKQPAAAIENYDRAIALQPRLAAAHCNRGNALRDLKMFEIAIDSYDRAIAIAPRLAEAHFNRGVALTDSKQLLAAVDSFANTIAIQPDYPFGCGHLLHAKMLVCDWHGLADLCERVESQVQACQPAADPFGYQAACTSERSLMLCAQIYARARFPAASWAAPNDRAAAPAAPHRRTIRVGYLCGEFREQATSILLTGVWEQHDRAHFQIYAFDNGWDDQSPRRRRIDNAFHEMVDISKLSDAEAAQAIRSREIDILVNLNGYFGQGRQEIFALRPCKVQVNYLGFPGTIGADYIDYLIADRLVIPPQSQPHYSEKIVYLPDCYQPNDNRREIAKTDATRDAFGLPTEGFVFCCFNNNYKIGPATFDGWARILLQVPGSVLWLLADNQAAMHNLRAHAAQRGLEPDRLVFANRLPLAEHLARHRLADLFIDTLPYNAHTTASDALWAGLPLLTCTGSTFPGRVASSLLSAVGLPELITSSQAAYEALAIELATHPTRLQSIKHKLAKNRLTTPLFDTQAFARKLEAAYKGMLEADTLLPAHPENV